MIFKHKDGELRISDRQSASTGYHIQVLFTDANLSFPTGRPKVEEILNTDRGNVDSNATYSEGPDTVITDPLPITVSARLDDTVNTSYLRDWLSGVTVINSHTLKTWKGNTTLTIGSTDVSTPSFADGSKMAYRVEVLWDGSNDYGWRLDEVYFPPDQQTITESEDAVTISINGLIYGPISPITSFSSTSNITV
jgi:hypothetical protein